MVPRKALVLFFVFIYQTVQNACVTHALSASQSFSEVQCPAGCICSLTLQSKFHIKCTSAVFQQDSSPFKEFEQKNIANVQVTDSNLKSLDEDFFMGLKLVENLVLSGNHQLRKIQSNAFKNVAQLKSLILANNKISSLEDDVFLGLRKLKVLDLRGNQLRSIPAGLLQPLKTLENLDLSGNKLKTIEKGVFDNRISLKTVDLSQNLLENLDGDYPFSWNQRMTHLNMSHNRIKTVQKGIALQQSLTNLDLSHNRIEDFEITDRKPIPYSALQFMNILQNLDLSHNNLKQINLDIFYKPANLFLTNDLGIASKYKVNINLKHNPLNCNCDTMPLWSFMRNTTLVQKLDFGTVTCEKPGEIQGKLLSDLNENDLCSRKADKVNA